LYYLVHLKKISLEKLYSFRASSGASRSKQ
jgi:hypothetical protein